MRISFLCWFSWNQNSSTCSLPICLLSCACLHNNFTLYKFLVCKIYWTMMSITSSILLWWLGIGQYDKCNCWAYFGIAKLCKILNQTLGNSMVINKFLWMMLPCSSHSTIYLYTNLIDFVGHLSWKWLVLGVQFHHKCLCVWAIVVHVFLFKLVWSLRFVCIMQFTIWIQM